MAPMNIGDIPSDELLDGEENQMWTFKFMGVDEKTGKMIDGASLMAKEDMGNELQFKDPEDEWNEQIKNLSFDMPEEEGILMTSEEK